MRHLVIGLASSGAVSPLTSMLQPVTDSPTYGKKRRLTRHKNARVRQWLMWALGAGLSLCPTQALAQTWARTFGGSGDDCGNSVQQTADGGFVVAGGDGGIPGGAYLIKTDKNGNKLWSSTFSGPSLYNYSGASSVCQTTDGGFVLTGNASPASSVDQNEYFYLLKSDANGKELWSHTFGSYTGGVVDFYSGHSVQQTTDGGFIVAGYHEGFDNEPPPTSWNYACLLKTDTSGKELWNQEFTGGALYSVQQTTDGGFIATGGFGLLKTDKNGNKLWSKPLEGRSVQQTTDKGFILAGKSTSGPSSPDLQLVKTDASGNAVWTKTFGGSSYDYGYSVQQTADGGFIVAGDTQSFGAGGDDLYLIKTDASGNEVWSKTFGGSGDEWGRSVQQTADGRFIVAGTTDSFGAGGRDVYLLMVPEPGTLVLLASGGLILLAYTCRRRRRR